MIKKLVEYCIVIIAIGVSSLEASAQQTGGARWLLTDTLPGYVRIIGDEADSMQMFTPDSIYNQIAGSTIFKVNRTELNPQDPWLIELRDSVLPLVNSEELMLMGIDLRGAASPEGPYDNNVRLSLGRAAALRRFITERLDSVAETLWLSSNVAEDYQRLLWIMEQRNDQDAGVVRSIIEDRGVENPELIKAELRKAQGGRLWTRLLNEIFPELRSARVVLLMRRINPRHDTGPLSTVGDVPLIEITPIVFTGIVQKPGKVEKGRKRHVLSVSSNLLYDAFWMPHYGMAPMVNLGLEWYPAHGNWTVKGQFMWPYYHKWSKNKFFQIRDYHLEVRYYLRPGWWHTGAYFGAYVNATKYGIGLSKTKGWQGEGYGGAVKVGYVVPLGKGNWRLDLHIAGGGWVSRYDPYVYGNPITGDENGDYYYDWTGKKDEFKRRNHRFTWFGPTEVGITITFDFLYRRVK